MGIKEVNIGMKNLNGSNQDRNYYRAAINASIYLPFP